MRPSRTWPKWVLFGGGMLLAAVAAAALFYLYAPRQAPPGQPPLARLDGPEGLAAFRQAFDGASDRTRLLVMLSPT